MSSDTAPTGRRIQPPRRPTGHHRHGGLAAIDFGTTNSTVTLYDPTKPPSVLPMPSDQRAVLSRETVRLLRSEPGPAEVPELDSDRCRAQWAALRDRLTADLAGGRPGLADAVEAEETAGDTLLYDVLLALDTAQAGAAAPLSGWLADRLHRCYDEAFGTPALERHSLYPVHIDDAIGPDEVPSRLDVTAVDPLRVRLGLRLGDGKALGEERGLKHNLDRPEYELVLRGGDRVGLESLLGGAFSFLLDRTEAFTGERDRPIDHVVVTYPTMAPPAVRRRLEQVLGGLLGIRTVDLRYDEAIAAALFFLMRDLGANQAVGVEALRARFRPVPGDDRHRVESTLVIDVGGGTTDIALITTHLHDQTPPLPGAAPGSTGRHYRLLPQLRGTSGRRRRGGDFLSLQVFHLIKAMIADHMLTAAHPDDDGAASDPEAWKYWQDRAAGLLDRTFQTDGAYLPGSLVEHALAALRRRDTSMPDTEAGQRVRDNVDRVLGTRTTGFAGEEATARAKAFDRLWSMAETAKTNIRPGESYRLPAVEVEDIAETVAGARSVPPGFGDGLALLTYPAFTDVAKPMLIEISRLAAALARTRLTGGDRLDRVILTGKASRLALAAEVVAREMAEHADGPPVPVVIERTYAKNAASMGAAWAAATSALGTSEPDEELLRQGATEVSIEVDNLLLEMPCALSIRKGSDRNRVLLAAGTGFQELTGGRLRAFAEVGRLVPMLVIEREVDGGRSQPWAVFRWSDLDGPAEPGLDPRIWPGQIRCGIEVDGGLDVNVLLWRGERPYHRVEQTSAFLRVLPHIDDLDVLATRLYVAGAPDQPPRPALAGVDLAPPTHERFVDESDTPRAALLGHSPLPPPDDDGRWAFLLRDDEGRLNLLGRLPAEPGAPVPHLVSADEEGAVRVHAGDPPLWSADSPADLQHRPGVVFRHQLGTPRNDAEDQDNPFDGTH